MRAPAVIHTVRWDSKARRFEVVAYVDGAGAQAAMSAMVDSSGQAEVTICSPDELAQSAGFVERLDDHDTRPTD